MDIYMQNLNEISQGIISTPWKNNKTLKLNTILLNVGVEFKVTLK